MRVSRLVVACLMVFGVIVGAALAQEGHPLKGSWLGDFGPNKTTRTPVFLHMDWDGKNITGTINPGTDNIPIKNATLTPPTPPPPGAGRGGGGNRGGNRGGGGDGNRGGDGAAAAAGGAGGAAAGGGGAAAGGAGGNRGGGGAGAGGRGGAAAGGATAQATPPAAPPPAAVPAAPAAPPQPDWLFHFEADGKDRSGAAVKYVVDGKVENVGLANRNIVGTWMVGTTKNDFRVVRQ